MIFTMMVRTVVTPAMGHLQTFPAGQAMSAPPLSLNDKHCRAADAKGAPAQPPGRISGP
jgi:hypothetical protein